MDQFQNIIIAIGAIALLAAPAVAVIRFVNAKRFHLLIKSLDRVTRGDTRKHVKGLRISAANRVDARLGPPNRTFVEIAKKYSKPRVWTLMVGSALLLVLPIFAALSFLVRTDVDGLALDSVIALQMFGWKAFVGDMFQNLSIVFGSLIAVFLFLWLSDYVVKRMIVLWQFSRRSSQIDDVEPVNKYILFLTSVALFVPIVLLLFLSSTLSHSSNLKAEMISMREIGKERCVNPDDLDDNQKKTFIAASFHLWETSDAAYACRLACYVSQDLTSYVLGLGFEDDRESCSCRTINGDGGLAGSKRPVPHLCESQAAQQALAGHVYVIEQDDGSWFKIAGTGDSIVLEAVADQHQDPLIYLYVRTPDYSLREVDNNDDYLEDSLDARVEAKTEESQHYFAHVSSSVGGSVRGVKFKVSKERQGLDL